MDKDVDAAVTAAEAETEKLWNVGKDTVVGANETTNVLSIERAVLGRRDLGMAEKMDAIRQTNCECVLLKTNYSQ